MFLVAKGRYITKTDVKLSANTTLAQVSFAAVSLTKWQPAPVIGKLKHIALANLRVWLYILCWTLALRVSSAASTDRGW